VKDCLLQNPFNQIVIDRSPCFTQAPDLTPDARSIIVDLMDEITLQVVNDEDSGYLLASCDAPDNSGGISTQGRDLQDLQQQLNDAVETHFDEGQAPHRIRPHFVNDPVLIQALILRYNLSMISGSSWAADGSGPGDGSPLATFVLRPIGIVALLIVACRCNARLAATGHVPRQVS
jgi:predicted RNase H-like HicB family nuclease